MAGSLQHPASGAVFPLIAIKKGEYMTRKRKGFATEADKIIGQNLRALRQLRGMTQQELADHLGITFQQIQKYEKGTNRLTAARVQEISIILNVHILDFYARLASPKCSALDYDILRMWGDLKNKDVKQALLIILRALKACKFS